MAFKVETSLTGIHSRSEDLVRASRDFDRGRATKVSLNRAFKKDARDLVSIQRSSGFTFLSDGQLRWQDFIRPFSETLGGLVRGADLSRWFDTNSFYKKPSVLGEITLGNASFITGKFAENSSFGVSKNKKIALPGPYSLASLVENKTYSSKEDLIETFAKTLKKVISSLSKHGYTCVQINEPALVYRYGESALTNRKHLETFVGAFSRHLSHSPVEIYLHTCFGDCSSILADLIELRGVSTIGIDFTQTSLSDIDSVDFKEKNLGCGCVDARNSLIESPKWISRFCSEATKALKPRGLVILPSSDLKFLPRQHADRKIRAIGQAAKLARNSLAKFRN